MAFYAYLLRCSDGSYHARHTDHLEHRMSQHVSGACGGYTANRRPVELVWSEDFPSREDAFAAERQIKGWSRAKKEALIAGDWDLISRLSRGVRNSADDSAGPSTGSG
jgi:predicted GIY-YIG superfamily endonuclease